jgi:hypothetical protein
MSQPEKENQMSSTLARRIRRIGFLPSTFTEVIEERAGKDASGAPCIHKIPRKVWQRNRQALSLAEHLAIAKLMRKEARAARKRGYRVPGDGDVAA